MGSGAFLGDSDGTLNGQAGATAQESFLRECFFLREVIRRESWDPCSGAVVGNNSDGVGGPKNTSLICPKTASRALS